MNEIANRTAVSVPAPESTDGLYRGWTPCMLWCDNTWPQGGWWYMTEGVFEFADERDALMFKLRWS